MLLVTVLVLAGFASVVIYVMLDRMAQKEEAEKLRITPKGIPNVAGWSTKAAEDEHSTVIWTVDELQAAVRSPAKKPVVKKAPVKKVLGKTASRKQAPIEKAPPRKTTATKVTQKAPVKSPTKAKTRSSTRLDGRRAS